MLLHVYSYPVARWAFPATVPGQDTTGTQGAMEEGPSGTHGPMDQGTQGPQLQEIGGSRVYFLGCVRVCMRLCVSWVSRPMWAPFLIILGAKWGPFWSIWGSKSADFGVLGPPGGRLGAMLEPMAGNKGPLATILLIHTGH